MVRGVMAGVDLGGTKILTGLFDGRGHLLGESLTFTRPAQGFEAVFDRIISSVDELRQEYSAGHELLGVAVGAPGPLDYRTGIIYEAPNLKLKMIPLGKMLQEVLKVPIWVDNDANLAALGEYTYGYPLQFESLLYLTVSTGIGGGIIINGDIYHGVDSGAGEFGHMTIVPRGPRCGCGNYGCLEALASGTAVARVAREEVSQGRCAALREAAGGSYEAIDARLVSEVAADGDPETGRIMQEAINYLGIGVANLVSVFNPQAIVIGGGLSGHVGLLERVEEIVKERTFARLSENLKILPARLGNRAGLIGCLALAERMIEELDT